MTAWPTAPLANVGKVVTGATPKTGESKFFGGDIPFITPSELDAEEAITTAPRTLSTLGAAQVRLLPAGTVLVSCIGTLGKVGFAGTPVATNQQINSIVFDPEHIYARFGYHACRRLKPDLERYAASTTVPIINKSAFGQIEIPVPPLPEQRRIATILDQADALRAKRRAALAQLDEMAQAIFVEMFASRMGRGCSTGYEKLGAQLSFVTSGGRNWSRFYSDTGARFIRSFDVKTNYVGNEEPVFVNAPDNAEARRTRVEAGDVLLTITGSRIGRVAPVRSTLAGSYISQHVAILRPKSSILPEFLSFYLNMPDGQSQIAQMQYGQTKPGLNFDQIRDFTVPLPSLESQSTFIKRLDQINRLRSVGKMHSMELNHLLASLQSHAFRGKL